MVLVKSVFVGLAASFMAAFATVVGVIAYSVVESRNLPANSTIGWDPVSFVRSPLSWVILGGPFLLGFVWKYRRVSRVSNLP
jgi:hypothetical protein